MATGTLTPGAVGTTTAYEYTNGTYKITGSYTVNGSKVLTAVDGKATKSSASIGSVSLFQSGTGDSTTNKVIVTATTIAETNKLAELAADLLALIATKIV